MCKYECFDVSPDPDSHQPVAGDPGEGHSVGEADAAYGEEVPRGAGAQCSVPGAS